MESLILKLFDIEAVKFGNFTLKSGIQSPIYFDLRVIISYPDILNLVAKFIWDTTQAAQCRYKSVCGVPYTALPIATCVCAEHGVPMLIRRKEAKDYGTKKIIEGRYDAQDKCLIIEDVVTSGSSVLETVQSLKNEGLVVTDAIVLLDREQGGKQRLKTEGITLHSVCTVTELLKILQNAGKLSDDIVLAVQKFIQDNNTFSTEPKKEPKPRFYSYKDRAEMCSNPMMTKLFTIMDQKQTNLAVSVDVTDTAKLLHLAETIGPHICILKTHVDILNDFTPEFTAKLSKLSDMYNFLLFEDRKFADIGSTVKKQITCEMYNIASWAHIVNAHGLPGPGLLQGLKEGIASIPGAKCQGCLLVAEMSPEGNLCTTDYTKQVVKMMNSNSDFVVGFISQSRLSESPTVVHMTPGVKLQEGVDSLGQKYRTPQEVITSGAADIIIVGRGIIEANDPVSTAKRYQEAGWTAYQTRLQEQTL